MSRSVAISALLVGLACSSVHAQAPATAPLWVQGGPYRLKTSVYRSSRLSPDPVLVVVLHGDAPFNKPDYQDTFAAKVSAAYSDVIVAAILRPAIPIRRGTRQRAIVGWRPATTTMPGMWTPSPQPSANFSDVSRPGGSSWLATREGLPSPRTFWGATLRSSTACCWSPAHAT
jgi:hypothetical protein